ncbi:MAG: LysM peptidoglycan-binding domain-containing protein, partial [Fibrobacterales bacterium]|nr:LysM peptidoglycan-binding domain-containing protein [Fibrobacterales bacterium]
TRERFAKGYAKLDKSKLVRWQHHKVKSGENLSVIAARYGVSVAALQSANRLKNSRLRVGQDLMIPDPSNGKASVSAPPGRGASETKSARGTITVRAGDSYYSLARTFNVTVEELKAANGATDDNLRVGQKLKLPGGSRAPSGDRPTYTVRKGDNLYSIAKTFGVTVAELKEWNRLDDKAQIFPGDRLVCQKPGAAKKAEPKKADSKKTDAKKAEAKHAEAKKASGKKTADVWYVVRAGDNLWDISRRNGTTVDQLLKWNEKAKDGIRPGDRLKVGER